MALLEVEPPVAVVLVLEPAIVVAVGELVTAEAEPAVEPGVQAGRVVVPKAVTNAHRAVVVARAAGALQVVARMAAAVVASGVTAVVVAAVAAVPLQVRVGMALGARLGLAVIRVRMLGWSGASAAIVVSAVTVRAVARARNAVSVSTGAIVVSAVTVRAVARAKIAVSVSTGATAAIVAPVGLDGSSVRSRVRSQLLSSVQRRFGPSARLASQVCSASRPRRRNGNAKSGSTKVRCERKPRMLPAVPERAAMPRAADASRRSLPLR
jgi:hypothetical protein